MPLPVGSIGGFPSIVELDQWTSQLINSLPANLQSTLIFTKVIGSSFQNRPIKAICIGMKCQDPHTPGAFYNAMHHSREPEGMAAVMIYMEWVINQILQKDESIFAILSTRSLWFVPLVNPDGYQYNIDIAPNGGGFQRKNVKPECQHLAFDKTGAGVDLNRNYDVCWNIDQTGSSNQPCAEDYAGKSAFSEPETQAIRDFVGLYKITISLNYHSFGRDLNTLPGCKSGLILTDAQQKVVADVATQLTLENGYTWGAPWTLPGLYPVNGDAADWMFKAHGIIAMSPEVAPTWPAQTDELGFWPRAGDITPFALENLEMNKHTAWFAGQLYMVQPSSSGVTKIQSTPPIGTVVDSSGDTCRCDLLTFNVWNRGLFAGNGNLVVTAGLLNPNNQNITNDPILVVYGISSSLCASNLLSRQTSREIKLCVPSLYCTRKDLSIYLAVQDENLCQLWQVNSGVPTLIRNTVTSGVCSFFLNYTTSAENTNGNNNPLSLCNETYTAAELSAFWVFMTMSISFSVGIFLANKLYKTFNNVHKRNGSIKYEPVDQISETELSEFGLGDR